MIRVEGNPAARRRGRARPGSSTVTTSTTGQVLVTVVRSQSGRIPGRAAGLFHAAAAATAAEHLTQ
eukprot:575267-Hanusia_phi.AAC.1